MKINTSSLVLIPLVVLVLASGDPPPPKCDLEITIQYLLDYVKDSKCTFIRNGKEYTSEEATSHIERKYKHYRKKIETPEDFIRLAATKSVMSGRPYRLRTKDGKTVLASQWLLEALNEYRKSKNDEDGQEEPAESAL